MAISRRRALLTVLLGGAAPMAFRDVAQAEITQYTYDALGRLKTVTYSNGATVTYDYDAAGNRTQWTQTPPASVQASLTASPTAVPEGSSATLTWSTNYATSASISPGVGSVTPLTSGSVSVTPSVTTTYTLTANGPNGPATSQATVTVYPKPTSSLSASPASIVEGTSTTLNWTSTNATAATINNGVGGVTPVPGGSVSVSPLVTTTYTLTVTGAGGQHTSQTTVTVTPNNFTRTIQITGSGPVNLRSLANAAGYNGAQNANVTFEVGTSVTITGAAGAPGGGIAIDSGAWPTGSYAITLTLRVKSGGVVRGGGGRGGVGGYHGTSGDAGGSGGDAIFCRLPMSIIIDGGGIVQGGGGGGGGGAGGNNGDPYEPQLGGGGGGGGGAPNGSGGAGGGGAPSGANGNPGSATTGGFGGDASLGSGGGTGALYGAIGNDGFNFFSPLGQAWGGSGGAGGYAVRKNGNAVNVTNNGTTAGGIG
ncbi:hypothetical protein EQG53_05040 [Brevundimonas diminuta]|uniref:YD repeat-containing protein n=2 Tax=Brevundimonas diminuta TaxID=293 RepID=A0A410NUV1_BREDI|nr:hypothetical protein EQG53_05040 [Brevundimonas diminuta]